MVIGLLGILKAGGAYLPLDPAYPPQRIAFMLDDARARLVVTQSSLVDRIEGSARLVQLDADRPEIARLPILVPLNRVRPENIAYLIYTSGSTGAAQGGCHGPRGIDQSYLLDAGCSERWFGCGDGTVCLS